MGQNVLTVLGAPGGLAAWVVSRRRSWSERSGTCGGKRGRPAKDDTAKNHGPKLAASWLVDAPPLSHTGRESLPSLPRRQEKDNISDADACGQMDRMMDTLNVAKANTPWNAERKRGPTSVSASHLAWGERLRLLNGWSGWRKVIYERHICSISITSPIPTTPLQLACKAQSELKYAVSTSCTVGRDF